MLWPFFLAWRPLPLPPAINAHELEPPFMAPPSPSARMRFITLVPTPGFAHAIDAWSTHIDQKNTLPWESSRCSGRPRTTMRRGPHVATAKRATDGISLLASLSSCTRGGCSCAGKTSTFLDVGFSTRVRCNCRLCHAGGGGGVDFASMRFATGNSFSRRPSGGSGLRDGLLCLGHARACELNPRCRAGYLRDVEYFSRD
jgi:hypothetical protein